jgi:pseudaminic acid synthase
MIKINNKLSFSANGPPLLIAEISSNHCGSKSLFLKHIIQAAKNGADLVKIQTYEPEDMLVNKEFKIKTGLWKNKKLYNLYKKACTPFDWHHEAFKLAKKNKILLFSSPFSERAFNFLKKFNPQVYKIASFEITDLNLINMIAKTKKPIILSTGLASNQEILNAVKLIKQYHNKIILLHCVSGYPTPIEEANLQNINELKKITGVKHVGFSDHTKSIYASTIASTYNICAIEKHFIIDKKLKSPDRTFSITPKELSSLKNNIKMNHLMKLKTPKKSENPSKVFRRSIFSIQNIKKNEIFTKNNIGCFRPMIGIGSENYFTVLGKKSKINIKKNTPIQKKNINYNF